MLYIIVLWYSIHSVVCCICTLLTLPNLALFNSTLVTDFPHFTQQLLTASRAQVFVACVRLSKDSNSNDDDNRTASVSGRLFPLKEAWKSQALLKTQHFLLLNCVLVYWGCCQRNRYLPLWWIWPRIVEKKKKKRLFLFNDLFHFIYHLCFRILKLFLLLTLIKAVLSHLRHTVQHKIRK